MSDKTKEKVKCTIPIKVNSYEELFNSLDYRNLAERDINGEVPSWIEEYISRVPQKLSSIDVELLINMPEDAMDKDKEEKSKLGIINYYNSFFILQKKFSLMGIKRICYYIFSALILLTCWFYIKTYYGESLLTSLLDSGGTVLLWEVMSLIFIESKNFKIKVNINKKLSKMNIVFKYI